MTKKIIINIYIKIFGLIFIFLIGQGFFGEGIDVVYSYKGDAIDVWNPKEFIGGIVATFILNGVYLGVYLGSFIAYLSLTSYFKKELNRNFVLFCAIVILLMLAWPLFLGVTNALRQGLSISIFIAIAATFKNDEFKRILPKFFLFLFILFFSHSYGRFLSVIVVVFYIFNMKLQKFIYFKGVLFGLALITLDGFKEYGGYDSDSTGFDMRYPFSLLIPIALFVHAWTSSRDIPIHTRFLIFSCLSTYVFAFKYFDNSLVYERLMWIPVVCILLLIPDIIIRTCGKKYSKIMLLGIYFSLSSLSLAVVGFSNY